MAKGAGMLAPGLATMLCVITTDAIVDAATADQVLRDTCSRTFDRVDSDGCMSTNDTVVLLSSGASGMRASTEDFQALLLDVCLDLTRQLVADAEGASKEVTIEVVGAVTEADAVEVGRSIARNNLLKCALFGNDPNWGRVLSAIGTTSAVFDADRLDVAMNGVQVCRNGAAGEPRDGVDLRGRQITITANRTRGRRRQPSGRTISRTTTSKRTRRTRRERDFDMSRERALAKAAVLVDALPWLERFHGKVVVIKYGGNAMSSPDLQRAFAEDIMFLRYAGLRPVVVHGGGPQITEHLNRLGIKSEFRGGLRVTTPEAMAVVRMVLVGQVNGDIVNLINRHGPFAVGLSGEDGGLLTAQRRPAIVDGEPVDIGQVGDVSVVDTSTVDALLDTARIPVIATVARGIDGLSYNVNADTAAAAIAIGVAAEKLVVLTDVEGLYADWPASTDVISQITADDLAQSAAATVQRNGPEDGGLPARRRGRCSACAHPRRSSAARAAAGDLHQRGRRDDGRPDDASGPHRAPAQARSSHDVPRPLGRGDDAQLRHPAGRPRPRVRRSGVGRRRARVPRLRRRHRGLITRPRPSRGGGGRHAPGRRGWCIRRTWRSTSPVSGWPSGWSSCSASRRGSSSPTAAPRRTSAR